MTFEYLNPPTGDRTEPSQPERRRTPRLPGPLRATVRGMKMVVANGEHHRYEIEALACDVSSCGLSLVMGRAVPVGTRLFIVLSFGAAWRYPHAPAPRIAALAITRRLQKVGETTWCVGVELTRHRFLDPETATQSTPSPPPSPVENEACRAASVETVRNGLASRRAALLELAWGNAGEAT